MLHRRDGKYLLDAVASLADAKQSGTFVEGFLLGLEAARIMLLLNTRIVEAGLDPKELL
jgi:hypothetical protein